MSPKMKHDSVCVCVYFNSLVELMEFSPDNSRSILLGEYPWEALSDRATVL